MIRNLKVLGLGLIAVFAFSAMAASSASAVDTFTSTKNPETISGTSVDKGAFKITDSNGGVISEVRCHTGVFHGAAVANGSAHATITASYVGTVGATDTGHCGAGTLGTADVNMNGCDYDLSGTTTGSDVGKTDATVSVLCEPNHEISISLSEIGVTLEIPAQTPTVGGATYTNTANGKVDAKVTATGVTYTCTPAFVCGLGGIPSEGNNADYNDEVEVSGANGAISVSTS
jgi:hypothetical protein